MGIFFCGAISFSLFIVGFCAACHGCICTSMSDQRDVHECMKFEVGQNAVSHGERRRERHGEFWLFPEENSLAVHSFV